MRDFYEILNVDRDASLNDIKRSYRKLAKDCHPDLNPDDPDCEARFKEITTAYEVLVDEDKRQIYDRYGEDGLNGNIGSGSYSGFGDIFNDIFDMFGGFGGSSYSTRNPNGPMDGADIGTHVNLTFKEAMFGVEKEIQISREEDCHVCHGQKTEKPESKHTCPTCDGTGQVRQITNSFLGQMVRMTTCTTCGGSGEIIDDPCKECHGSGREKVSKKIKINIPAGVDNGTLMTIRSEGHKGINGGYPGDVMVQIGVQADEVFTRRGNDLFVEIPISYTQAVLGDTIKVPTINEVIDYNIPNGTESGRVFKISGKGAPKLQRNGFGDLYATVKINVPKKVSKEEKKLLEKLMEHNGEFRQETDKGFFDKIKDFLTNE